MSGQAAIDAQEVVKRFGALTAVDHISLRVEEGELFGLLGPNGAGKTTLIRVLTALMPPTAGSAKVAGYDVVAEKEQVRRAIGVVPQALTTDLDLTAWENLDYYGRFFDVPDAERHQRAEELLHKVGLWERRDDLVATFSGGMRRRLEVARGLVHRPKILFLDEPTVGLDPQSRRVIWEIVRDLRESATLTVVVTTHSMEEAEALCGRVAIVDQGKIVALGSPEELKSTVPGSDCIHLSADGVPADFEERMRRLPGVREVQRAEAEWVLRVDSGATALPTVLDAVRDAAGTVRAVRLERITLEDVFIHYTGRAIRDEKPQKVSFFIGAGAPRGGRL